MAEFVFGKFLKDRRISLGLTPKQLAEKLGYRNLVKGIRRISEAEEANSGEFKLQEIMAALNVTEADRTQCAEEQKRQVLELVKTLPKFKPILLWHVQACFYAEERIPEELTTLEQMMEFASDFAKNKKRPAMLLIDYHLKCYVRPDGTITKPTYIVSSWLYSHLK